MGFNILSIFPHQNTVTQMHTWDCQPVAQTRGKINLLFKIVLTYGMKPI